MSRHPPGSNPGQAGLPVSMSSTQISTRRQWIAFARLLGPHLPTPPARLTPRTLTTTALDRSSSGWFAASLQGADNHRTPTARPLHLRSGQAVLGRLLRVGPGIHPALRELSGSGSGSGPVRGRPLAPPGELSADRGATGRRIPSLPGRCAMPTGTCSRRRRSCRPAGSASSIRDPGPGRTASFGRGTRQP
jgi:hypothetical protein